MATIQQVAKPAIAPLTNVALMFRNLTRCDPKSVSGNWESLTHVVSLVSSFLDSAIPKRWSIERACERGLGLRMLRRLAAHEASEGLATDPFYRAYLASKGLVAAIRRSSGDDGDDGDDGDGDDVEIVRWMCCEYCPCVVPVKAMLEAAKCGRLGVLQWLFERYPSVHPNEYLAMKAVKADQLVALKWLFRRMSFPDWHVRDLLAIARSHERLEISRWLYRQTSIRGQPWLFSGFILEESLLADMVAGGKNDIFEYLAEQDYQLSDYSRQRFSTDMSENDLRMIKWLDSQQFTEGSTYWLDVAAAGGRLDIAKWVHENFVGDICSADAMDRAAENGHFGLIKWLHVNRTEGCTTRAMDVAARNGQLEILQWLHVNRAEGCTMRAMDLAAEHGHLEVVQWLDRNRMEGCTSKAMDCAAENGHLVIVRYLHEHRSEGCSVAAMNYAASAGHLEVVQWLHANRLEGCTIAAMDNAAGGGHLQIVQWLHEHRTEGCSCWAIDFAACNGHLNVVIWLHENRNEGCSTDAMDGASSVEVLQWLLDNRHEGCTQFATYNALRYGNFEKLLFLREEKLDQYSQLTAVEDLQHCNFEIYQWLRANVSWNERIDEVERDYVSVGKKWGMFFQFESDYRD